MRMLRCLVLLGLAIAACGPAAPGGQPTAAPAQPAAAGQPVTFTFWHGMNGTEPGTQGGSLRYLVDQYKQVAPNVSISLDFTPYTANELEQKVAAGIAANSTPDLVQGFETDVAAWYQAGAIVPLDEYVNQTLTQ